MKTALKITNVLSWINIIIAGILVLGGLIGTLMSAGALTMLLSVVLTGSIVLHSYATLQLRKSILNPEIPLSNQTSGGLRMVGFVALFFAIMNIMSAVMIIQNAPEAAKQITLPFKPEGFDIVAAIKFTGIFSLLFSIGVAANVMLSFQLLRGYMAGKKI
ncbi:hypothetical protein DC498_06885 [Terrimonas sp.]|uniref:hypothetical protein n=1 Tax=Terrimonas sp. TaxID=1914338 RepID=UPI000D51ECA3|nr:hypothetical protein [Terrimonas sp.]PVD53083.1 hypothetical protein DC498_06885 [Terrimonas sp.]